MSHMNADWQKVRDLPDLSIDAYDTIKRLVIKYEEGLAVVTKVTDVSGEEDEQIRLQMIYADELICIICSAVFHYCDNVRIVGTISKFVDLRDSDQVEEALASFVATRTT